MLLRRQVTEERDEHIDMTPMVDVVFQLMTFMLFSVQMTGGEKVDVPPARHGVGVEESAATFLTLLKPAAPGAEPRLLLGNGEGPPATARPGPQGRRRRASAKGRRKVVLQADGAVPHGEVLKVAAAVTEVEGRHAPHRRPGTDRVSDEPIPRPRSTRPRARRRRRRWRPGTSSTAIGWRSSGRLTTEAVRAALARGDLRDDDLIRPAGTTVPWARLADLPALVESPAAEPPPRPRPPTPAAAARPDDPAARRRRRSRTTPTSSSTTSRRRATSSSTSSRRRRRASPPTRPGRPDEPRGPPGR